MFKTITSSSTTVLLRGSRHIGHLTNRYSPITFKCLSQVRCLSGASRKEYLDKGMDEFRARKDNISTKDIAAFYDEFCGDYDSTLKDIGWIGPQKSSEMLFKYQNMLPLDNAIDDIKILEIGCGTGLFGEIMAAKSGHSIDAKGTHRSSRRASSASSDYIVHGVDISSKSLAIAENKKVYSKLEQCNIDSSEFGALYQRRHNEYDVIVCSGVLSYINNKSVLFGEWYKLLKHDGLVILTHREDEMKNDIKEFENMENEQKWKRVEFTDPMMHLPHSEVYGENIKAHFYVGQVKKDEETI